MSRLYAKFDIKLPGPGQFLFAFPEDANLLFHVTRGDFNVEIMLIRDSWGAKHESEENWTYGVERVLVTVSREESEFPPPVYPDAEGRRDYTIQGDYFKERTNEYAEVAREAINRMIRYFRFSLHTPLLQELPITQEGFGTPQWTNEDNEVVGNGWSIEYAQYALGLHGELGVKKLTPDLCAELNRFWECPDEPSLVSQLLSDAQGAWFEKNLRRSVLELAIACEVAVKRRFFSNETPAGAAFDYLEDKAKVSIRVLELVDKVAQEAFGKSYRVEHPEEYTKIDYLFRCRNKIAHRGELSFRDDSGSQLAVDANTVASWWNSSAALVEWLSGLST